MRKSLVVGLPLFLLACGDSPPPPPQTPATTTATVPPPVVATPPPPAPPPVTPTGATAPPVGNVRPAKDYEVPVLDLGPQAEGLVLEAGKPTKSQGGITATLLPPNRRDVGGTTITTWNVKLATRTETMDVNFEGADLYFEGDAYGYLMVLRDKKENKDEVVLTLVKGAPKPLTENEAVKLAENEMGKRSFPRGTKQTARTEAGAVTVTFVDDNGDGTAVVVGRYTKAVRNMRPIVGKKGAH